MASSEKHIVTIGAGIIGLQTSLSLLEAGHRVTIIAKHIPGDQSIEYCSPWAGAQWRSHASASDKRQQAWDLASYKYWMDLARREERSGVSIRRNALIYDDWNHPDLEGCPRGVSKEASKGQGFWFKDHVEDFHVVTSPEDDGLSRLKLDGTAGKPGGLEGDIAAAVSYSTAFVDVPKYLPYLKERILEFNGRGRLVKIEDGLPDQGGLEKLVGSTLDIMEMGGLVDKKSEIDAVVNATGLAAGKIVGGDEQEKMVPVRGQVLIVKGVAEVGSTRMGPAAEDPSGAKEYIAYVLPRPQSGTTVIGGCKEVGKSNPEAEEETSQLIMTRAKLLCPELATKDGNFDVLGVQVGLRPSRTGGARVEKEVVGLADGTSCTVIHAYGHGGAGFQNSLGIGKEVLDIFEGTS